MRKPNAFLQRIDHRTGAQDNEGIVLLYPEMFVVQALQEIELEGEEWDIISNICKGNQRREQEKLVARVVHKLQQFPSHIVYVAE